MRRGCIVISDIKCDGCGRTVKHPERYLRMSEEGDVEAEEEKARREKAEGEEREAKESKVSFFT